MNSGKIVADGWTGRVDGTSKVLQEVLADLKMPHLKYCSSRLHGRERGGEDAIVGTKCLRGENSLDNI